MKNKKIDELIDFSQMKLFYPPFAVDPLQKAAWEIEKIIVDSGLPYYMEYRPDDNYFTVKLYNKNKEN